MADKFPELMIGTLSSKQIGAHLSFSGQGPIHGGSSTKPVGFNEYLVPVAESEHFESHSLYFFYLGEDRALLFRLLVRHINTHSQKVELSLGYFRYER